MSAPPGQAHSVDVLRKGVIVAALVGGIILLHQYAMPTGADPRGLMALGFVVLAAYTIGELAEVFRLPHITGYLLAGLILGPSAAHEVGALLPPGALPVPFDEGVLSEPVIDQLSLLDTLALPLIALTAGGELHLKELRKGIVTILGLLTGQVVFLLAGFMAFAVAVGGFIPGIGLPELSTLTLSQQLAVGSVLGALGLATSAAATIAIILGVGAKGPMTRNTLSVVVMKDVAVVVLFAATTAWAGAALGTGAEGGLSTAFFHIGLSLVIGVVVGGIVHLYLRFIAVERLLFLVGLIYTTAFLCGVLHAEVALVFIVAGFVVANFSDQGELLIHDVERLSLPVFVVFFTLAGARLHVDVIVQMAGYAAALATLRMLATWAGMQVGGRLSGADSGTLKYGWMGMIAQAGLAISLAGQLPAVFPGGLGQELFSLVLAGVAVHEVIGPALLQTALSKAGEVPTQETDEVDSTPDTRTESPELPQGDPFGPPVATGSPEVDRTIAELEADLRTLAQGPLGQAPPGWVAEGQQWVQSLRHAFLRAHRRVLVLARDPDTPPEAYLGQLRSLESAWRSAAWSRAAAETLETWSPVDVVAHIDRRIDGLPITLAVPWDPTTLAPRSEPPLRALLRASGRVVRRITGPTRDVPVRDLFRYHLGGDAVSRLDGIAALPVRLELDAAQQVASLFADIARRWPTATTPTTEATLRDIRADVSGALEDLAAAMRAVDAELSLRATAIIGTATAEAKVELGTLGTVDLPLHYRRFSRVFDDRSRAVGALTHDLDRARALIAARFRAVGAELEVATLQVSAGTTVRQQALGLGRIVDDLGVRPLAAADARVTAALDAVGDRISAERSTAPGGAQVAQELRDLVAPASQALHDARRFLERLEATLHDECSGAVQEVVQSEVARLTERIAVPDGPIEVGDWALPGPRGVVDLPLRESVRAWLDTRVAEVLESSAGEAAATIEQARATVADLIRVLDFNTDLAASELTVFGDHAPTHDACSLVQEMLSGTVRRAQPRLQRALEHVTELRDRLPDTVSEAVPATIATLSADLLRGDVDPLRRLARAEATLRRSFTEHAGTLSGSSSATRRAQQLLGLARWHDLQGWLHGPPAPRSEAPEAPAPHPGLPVVYRRLFTDQVTAAIELSPRHSRAVSEAVALLTQPEPSVRAVAVIAHDPATRAMLAEAILAGIHGPVQRHHDPAPHGLGPQYNDDLRRTISLTPAGLERADDLAQAILTGSRPWVLAATPETWATAAALSAIGTAVPIHINPGPLTVHELRTAILGRHAMSGFGLQFDVADLLGFRLRRALEGDQARLVGDEAAWFEHLHTRARGRLSDALRTWMAAVSTVEDDTLTLGPIDPDTAPDLRHLDDTTLVILRRALAEAHLQPEVLAQVTGEPTARTRGLLAALSGRGFLLHHNEGYSLPPHLEGPVRDALDARGWSR